MTSFEYTIFHNFHVRGDLFARGYSGFVEATDARRALQLIWALHNSDDRPDKRLAPSLSIDDVVTIYDDQPTHFLCQMTGWQELSTFPGEAMYDPIFSSSILDELIEWRKNLDSQWVNSDPVEDNQMCLIVSTKSGLSDEATLELAHTLGIKLDLGEDGYLEAKPMFDWNDEPTRTLSEVQKVFDDTIERLKEQANANS